MIAWADRRGQIFLNETLPAGMLLLATGKERRLTRAIEGTADVGEGGYSIPGMRQGQDSAEAVEAARRYRDRLQLAMVRLPRRRPA